MSEVERSEAGKTTNRGNRTNEGKRNLAADISIRVIRSIGGSTRSMTDRANLQARF